MKFLIKNARIVHPNLPEPTEPTDIFIENGVIQKIGNSLNINELNTFDATGRFVSPGFMDIGAQVGEPGFEHRETLETAARAALAGGFTQVACLPNNDPVMDSKTAVFYLKNRNFQLPIDFLPIGSLSVAALGVDMAELFDMHTAGAVAFSDGTKPVQDAGLMLRSMQYVQAFGGKIMNHPHHKTIATGGQMHEGLLSTELGLRGISAISEEIIVQRDLQLAEYANGQLHFSNISTRKSVELIRNAKKQRLRITCSVAVWNLGFTDKELAEFESNWKLLPPLRLASDAEAVRAGLVDGTIDFIESAHTPWDEESKNLEFPYAQFGAIGLETAFSVAHTFLHNQLTINQLVFKMSVAPRQFLGLEIPKIEVGATANLTVFDTKKEWIFSERDIWSKSKNSPLIGRSLTGRVEGVFTKHKWHAAR